MSTKLDNIDKKWTLWTKNGHCGQKMDTVDKNWTILTKYKKRWTKLDNMDKVEDVDQMDKIGQKGQNWVI